MSPLGFAAPSDMTATTITTPPRIVMRFNGRAPWCRALPAPYGPDDILVVESKVQPRFKVLHRDPLVRLEESRDGRSGGNTRTLQYLVGRLRPDHRTRFRRITLRGVGRRDRRGRRRRRPLRWVRRATLTRAFNR